MLEMGGEEARRRLFARINSNRMASGGGTNNGADNAAASQEFNAEEAKVQEHGDIGQGERLAGAKRAA